MTRFLGRLQLLADKLKAFDKPAIVHLEPDFWGYAPGQFARGDPTKFRPRSSLRQRRRLPDESDRPRPGARSASFTRRRPRLSWVCTLRIGQPTIQRHRRRRRRGRFLGRSRAASGPSSTDILDRDAGCFEANAFGVRCGRGAHDRLVLGRDEHDEPELPRVLAGKSTAHRGKCPPPCVGKRRWACRATPRVAWPINIETHRVHYSSLTFANSSMQAGSRCFERVPRANDVARRRTVRASARNLQSESRISLNRLGPRCHPPNGGRRGNASTLPRGAVWLGSRRPLRAPIAESTSGASSTSFWAWRRSAPRTSRRTRKHPACLQRAQSISCAESSR